MGPVRRLVPLLALVAAPLVLATPAAAATSLTATPNTGLTDGQVIAVSGAGFTPDASVGWCQAVQDATPAQDDCGTAPGVTNADSEGNIAVSQQLVRLMFVPSIGATVDCANPPNACVLAAAEVNNIGGTAAYAQLQFAPAAPLPPVIVPNATSTAEGNTGAHDAAISVHLTVVPSQTVTADWTTIHVPGAPDFQADPATDYTPANGTVTFAPGETTQSVVVSVNGDTLIEPDEYFAVSFTNPTNATIGGYYGLGGVGIQNDDVLPKVVPGVVDMNEGNAGTHDVMIPVSLSAPSSEIVTAPWTTIHVSGAPGFQADPGTDYTAASGTVTFAPGETAKSVVVSVNGDLVVEPNEYFVVAFGLPTNAKLGGYYGLGASGITNDD